MLQIPKHAYSSQNNNYEAFASDYLPEHYEGDGVYSAKQHEILTWLNADIAGGHFYFVVDIKNGTITHCNGVNLWLGYTDAHFTLKKYREIFHPAHALVQSYYAAALWRLLVNSTVQPTAVLQPVSTALFALKNSHGDYLYCRRLCTPFNVHASGRLTSYLCRFTVINHFKNEPYYTRLYQNGRQLHEVEKTMQADVQRQFAEDAFFSPQELRLLKKYVTPAGATSATVAKALKISKYTVNIYNKRIMEKAEKIFGEGFTNAKAVAEYISSMHLI